jgi:hypothetical protein
MMSILERHGTAIVLVALVSASFACPVQPAGADGVFSRFFDRHPVIRKAAKGAALGVLTGGVFGPALGHSVAEGAALGAGKGAAVSTGKHYLSNRDGGSGSGRGSVKKMASIGKGVGKGAVSASKRVASGIKDLFD